MDQKANGISVLFGPPGLVGREEVKSGSKTQPSKNSKPDFNNGSQGTDNPLLLIEADTG